MTGAQQLTLEVATSMLLNANQRLNRHDKAHRARELRALAFYAFKEAHLKPYAVPVHIGVSLRFVTSVRRDVHNWQPTLKPIIDGLVDAGMLPDDNDRWLTGPDLRRGLLAPDAATRRHNAFKRNLIELTITPSVRGEVPH